MLGKPVLPLYKTIVIATVCEKRGEWLRLLFALVLVMGIKSVARAQDGGDNSVLSGEIEIEDISKGRVRSPKQVNQDAALQFIETMNKAVEGDYMAGAPELSDGAAQYLAVSYLYCLTKRGPCPFLLDSVLEADVINARRSGTDNECPTMTAFWKAWIADDLEQRGKYLLSIGTATSVANFNSRQRPRYIKCKGTVATELAESLSSRYGPNGEPGQALRSSRKFLSEIKERQIDVYQALGVSFAGGAQAEEEKSKRNANTQRSGKS